MTNKQTVTKDYAIYNSDCIEVLKEFPDSIIDLSIYSPPFAGLYNYSSSEYDFSNCNSREEFLNQYEYLIKDISRLTKDGRITAVHCTDIADNNGLLWDFPHEIIKLHSKYNFHYANRITIWKEPLKVRMRTMVKSLMHKIVIEDSTSAFPAMPDYVLIFRKTGKSEIPVTHNYGLREYYGETPMLPAMVASYGSYEELRKKYINHKDVYTNKLSHIIWQRYASSVWDDIRIDNVLKPLKEKNEDYEKHLHPLQLDVILRLVELYSNPGEKILTPFMGVGSEVYGACKLGRYGIGIELKESYYKQAENNLKNLANLPRIQQLELI